MLWVLADCFARVMVRVDNQSDIGSSRHRTKAQSACACEQVNGGDGGLGSRFHGQAILAVGGIDILAVSQLRVTQARATSPVTVTGKVVRALVGYVSTGLGCSRKIQ
jgi:hypothetical protein